MLVCPSLCRELSQLHKANAVNKTAAHEALLSAEQTARQELTCALENQRVEAQREKESLALQVRGTRDSCGCGRCEGSSPLQLYGGLYLENLHWGGNMKFRGATTFMCMPV